MSTHKHSEAGNELRSLSMNRYDQSMNATTQISKDSHFWHLTPLPAQGGSQIRRAGSAHLTGAWRCKPGRKPTRLIRTRRIHFWPPLCEAGPPNTRISVFRARVHATSSQAGREVHAPTCPLFLRDSLPRKGSVGRRAGRCKQRHSGCKQRRKFRTATSQPPRSTQVTSQNVIKQSLANSVWPALDRCWWPCSAVTVTRDVAWRTAIDAGRRFPRASRIGTLGARSRCVEVEHSLLSPGVDEQPIWCLSTPRSN